MSPPTYGDLGKSARDVFGKGYHFGTLKLDVKTKTATGVEFNSGAVSSVDSGKVGRPFYSINGTQFSEFISVISRERLFMFFTNFSIFWHFEEKYLLMKMQ